MKKLITPKYRCSLCGKEFDKDNIVLKEKDLPLCEKCYEESVKAEIEAEKSSLEKIFGGFNDARLRMMKMAEFTDEANKAFVLCEEVVRRELG